MVVDLTSSPIKKDIDQGSDYDITHTGCFIDS
mgnify:CR=1 FL=1